MYIIEEMDYGLSEARRAGMDCNCGCSGNAGRAGSNCNCNCKYGNKGSGNNCHCACSWFLEKYSD